MLGFQIGSPELMVHFPNLNRSLSLASIADLFITNVHKTYLFLSGLLEVPSIADLLRVHVVHSQERFTPVVIAERQRNGLLAVEHRVRLLNLLACLHNGQRHEVITTALMSGHHIILVRQVRDGDHLLHGITMNNIATATVGKRLALEHCNTPDIRSFCPIDPVAKVPYQVLPENISIGLGKHIPLLVGAHFPSLLYHVEEFVLIKVPAILAVHIGGTILLGNWTVILRFVKIKLFAAFSDILLDVFEDIVYLVLVNLLVLSGLVSFITPGIVA